MRQWLLFDRLLAGVLLDVNPRFLSAIGAVFSNWDFELSNDEPAETFAAIHLVDEKYIISSPFMDGPVSYSDPLNSLCKLVVEAAWAQLRERRDMLCLHGAAVRFNGRLVVFPSTRRAGKSTLTVGLMAAGEKIFTDDFLPLVVDGEQNLCGFAQGISPRIRLPLPAKFAEQMQGFLEQHAYIQNRQYKYIVPKCGEASEFGALAPIGALVFLDRQSDGPPRLEKVSPTDALQSLIKQNFSRAMKASAILNVLAETVENTQAFRLTYSDVTQAVEMIRREFGSLETDPVRISRHEFEDAPETGSLSDIDDVQSAKLIRMSRVSERQVEMQRFLSGRFDRDIIHLNAAAAGIWQLLEQPISMPEILEVLTTAFPGENPAQLRKDIITTLTAFHQSGLVCLAPPEIEAQKGDANCASGYDGDLMYADQPNQNGQSHGE